MRAIFRFLFSHQLKYKLRDDVFLQVKIKCKPYFIITGFFKNKVCRAFFLFRNLKAYLIGVNQYLQQFLDNKPAMFNFCFVDKPCKVTYIRNKKQLSVFRFFSFKVTINKSDAYRNISTLLLFRCRNKRKAKKVLITAMLF